MSGSIDGATALSFGLLRCFLSSPANRVCGTRCVECMFLCSIKRRIHADWPSNLTSSDWGGTKSGVVRPWHPHCGVGSIWMPETTRTMDSGLLFRRYTGVVHINTTLNLTLCLPNLNTKGLFLVSTTAAQRSAAVVETGLNCQNSGPSE